MFLIILDEINLSALNKNLMSAFYKIPYFSFSICVCFCFNMVNAQRKLTTQEIFDRWTKENGVLHLPEKEGLEKFIDFDSILDVKIYTALKELEQSNIDTLGLFVASFPGYYSLHPSCYSGYYPVRAYLFWQSQGVGYSEKITGKCENAFKQNNLVKQVFKFYEGNSIHIDSEYIMPVILKFEIDSTGRSDYEHIVSFDIPQYFIFCKISGDVKFLNFDKGYYTNQESVFLKYNLQSKSYEWFKQIDSLFKH